MLQLSGNYRLNNMYFVAYLIKVTGQM